MTVLSLHHWSDWRAGLGEMRHFAPRRLVVTDDPVRQSDFWLVRDYLPGVADFDAARAPSIDSIADALGGQVDVVTLDVPWDCTDGVLPAHWRRPRASLDAQVRSWCSGLSQSDPSVMARGIARLERDLDRGAWQDRYAALLEMNAYDAGVRLVVSAQA
jgi:hypothetical protein